MLPQNKWRLGIKRFSKRVFRSPEEYEEVMQRQPYSEEFTLAHDENEPLTITDVHEEYSPETEH